VRPLPSARGLFCNRTLNFRSIKAVGYDMDYTLVHYHVEAFERRAYEHTRLHLAAAGLPVEGLEFDARLVVRGLAIDTLTGNLVKANRFGFVKKALHGSRPLSFEAQRDAYQGTIVDLADARWAFLNTLFSLSEACLYAQLVDRLDEGRLPQGVGYADLYRKIRQSLDRVHLEGQLKQEILADPERFVVRDGETALALLDQKHAGKKLLLITNSEWEYTNPMMRLSFEPFLPRGMTWRELFDVVIVAARKPEFFTTRQPLFEVATEEGLLRPVIGDLKPGAAYYGGSASQVEKHLGLSGDEILYVGDHMFGDVHVTKQSLHWRTALILRELEDEVKALDAFRAQEATLADGMAKKEALEAEGCTLRLELQRRKQGYGLVSHPEAALHERLSELRRELDALDVVIAPAAKASSEMAHPTWGLLMRAGNDKSHLARQVERYADVYTSRVSNFLAPTPFVYLRSPRGSLPHDP
jgi:5'-nucleotidase